MENQDQIKKDISKYSDIENVSNSKGGKIIVDSLQKDVTSTINKLTAGYKTLSHIELCALVAELTEKLNLLRVLGRAKDLKKMAQEELEFLLSQ